MLGYRISDSSWYRLQPLFDSQFPQSRQNVIWLAEIKKQLPKCDLRLLPIAEIIKQANNLVNNHNQISGHQLKKIMAEHNITVHRNTLTKWFRPFDGFRETKLYSVSVGQKIILAAYAYKFRQQVSDLARGK